MFTAILPIRIGNSTFWSSRTGMEWIDKFLGLCKGLSFIDRFIVPTLNERVAGLVVKYGMEISNVELPKGTDKPYTFKQTLAIGRQYRNLCKHQKDALIIADHRNLFLTTEIFHEAYHVYREHADTGLISLAFCRDYPCQFRSYINFVGCTISSVIQGSRHKISSDDERFTGEKDLYSLGIQSISIEVSADGSMCKIVFRCSNDFSGDLLVQSLPFGKDGLFCNLGMETLVRPPEKAIIIQMKTERIKGLVFLFMRPAEAGSYDTVEFFMPVNAPWEIGESLSVVFDKKDHKPLLGRQNFPFVYSYDGSLCILSKKGLTANKTDNLKPMIIKRSVIVSSWVDYWSKIAIADDV